MATPRVDSSSPVPPPPILNPDLDLGLSLHILQEEEEEEEEDSDAFGMEPKADTDSDYVVGEGEEEEDISEDFESESDEAEWKQELRRNKEMVKVREKRVRACADETTTRKLRPLKVRKLVDTSDDEKKSNEEMKCARPPELFREISEAEAGQQISEIREMWEMAAVLDFLSVFRPVLNLNLDFSAGALEHAIVRSPGPGLLSSLHMGLMLGISPRSQINRSTWATFLGSKLLAQHMQERGCCDLHFYPRKGHEVQDYASLSSMDRVQSLKALCELRGDREDIRDLLDTVIRPKRAKVQVNQKGRQKAIQNRSALRYQSVEDFRRQPYGEGFNGERYWYIDMWSSCGIRMYKELEAKPPPLSSQQVQALKNQKRRERSLGKQRGGKGRRKNPARNSLGGSQVQEGPPCGEWKVVASSISELESLGQMLGGSRKRKYITIGKRILTEIIPELQDRELAEQRKHKAAEKLRVDLGNVILDNDGGLGRYVEVSKPGMDDSCPSFTNFGLRVTCHWNHKKLLYCGRSRRKRTHIASYRFDDFDRLIEEGIQATGISEEAYEDDGVATHQLVNDIPLDVRDKEAMRKGCRRGRSASRIQISSSYNNLAEDRNGEAEGSLESFDDDELSSEGLKAYPFANGVHGEQLEDLQFNASTYSNDKRAEECQDDKLGAEVATTKHPGNYIVNDNDSKDGLEANASILASLDSGDVQHQEEISNKDYASDQDEYIPCEDEEVGNSDSMGTSQGYSL